MLQKNQPAWTLTYEHGAAVDVEDLPGDETGPVGAEKEDGTGDLVGAGDSPQGDGGQHLLGRLGVREGSGGHVGGDPAGGDAVGVDAVAGELAGEAFGEAEEGAFAGGVVGVEGLAALGGGGGDEDDVAADAGDGLLPLHLGDGGADEAEGAVEVDAESGAPLGVAHGGDGFVVRWPDAVVDDEAVEPTESGNCCVDEGCAVGWSGKFLLEGVTETGAAAGFSQIEGLGLSCAVAEGYAGSGAAEEANGGGPDAAGASGDECGTPCQRECDAWGYRWVRHIFHTVTLSNPL